MRTLCIFLFFYSQASFSQDVNLLRSLDAKDVLQFINSTSIKGNTHTPIAIRFIKNGNTAPSCLLINKDNHENIIDLVSPDENGFLANCSSNIANPILFSVDGRHFGLYRYSIEDPRHVLTHSQKIVFLKENEITSCDNEDELLKLARGKSNKYSLKRSLISAVQSIGCKTTPH